MTKDEAFDCCMPLLRALSARFYACSYSASREDLFQAGCVGILLAARRYQAGYGAKFSTYALPWILGEMKRTLRLGGMNARSAGEASAIRRQRDVLYARLGREPTIEQLAAACGLAKERVLLLLEMHRAPLSLEQSPESGARMVEAGFGCADTGREEKLDLLRSMEALSKLEKQIILLRYFRDYTQRETAELLGISQSSISKAENRALDRMRLVMKD